MGNFTEHELTDENKRLSRLAPDMNNYAKGIRKLPEVLKRMGFSQLRAGQGEAIHSILKGIDTLVLLPTGAGKTATWLIPALCLDWSVVVFSPLLALIADQAQSCARREVKTGELSGDALTPTNSATLRAWADGSIQVMFTAPERLRSDEFQNAMEARTPDMVIVDEVHTLFEWEGFRQFHVLKSFIKNNPKIKVVAGLTATATKDAEKTIYDYLGTNHMNKVYVNTPRTNLRMRTSVMPGMAELAKIVIAQSKSGSGIVYCNTRSDVEEIAEAINLLAPSEAGKPAKAVIYHGGDLQSSFKQANHGRFMSGESPIMVATNAYGMGIDKEDIRWVIHAGQPKSLEAYVQECGRGGRDGKLCECTCYKSDRADHVNRHLVGMSNPTSKDAIAMFDYIRLNCEKDGTFRARNKEIAEKTRLDPSIVSSLVNTFVKAGVLSRTKVVTDVVEIGLLLPIDSKDGGKNYDKYRAALNKLSRLEFGVFKVSLKKLSDELGVQLSTVQANLNKWKREELISYNPPPKGDDYTVKKSLDGLSLDYLDEKRKKAYKSMQVLGLVLETEEAEDKQKIIDEYFRTN